MTAEGTRILVLVTTRASPDGIAVHRYEAGQTYGPDSDPPMPADLAATFLAERWAERCDGDQIVGSQPATQLADLGECLWCPATYTARTGRGGPDQRFCSDGCRSAYHQALRRWARREFEAGRVSVSDLRKF